MLGKFLCCGFLLTLGLQFSQAQDASSKPEAPVPKRVQIPLPTNSSPPFARSTPPTTEPKMVADLPVFAATVAAYAAAEGCQQQSCSILVMNFTLPDGKTSAYGIQLADKLSTELARKEYKLNVIDRTLLQSFLGKYRIPSESIKRTVVRSIAEELGSRFMVFGTTEKFENGLGRLTGQVIDLTSKKWDGYDANVDLGLLDSRENLEPTDPFPPLPTVTSSTSGEIVQRTGVDGGTVPSCTYMPNPPYSEGARKLKLSGSVTVEAVINTKGELENIRIAHGMIGGLNETTLATMRSWRCRPALKDGMPIPVLVQFTVNFRLY